MNKSRLFLTILILYFFKIGYSQTTIVLQPNAENGKDARVHSLDTYTSGTTNEFEAMAWTYGGTPGIERCLIDFDFSQIPVGAEIVSAKLSLYDPEHTYDHHSNISGSNVSVLQRITSSWEEDGVTWDNQPTTTVENQALLDEITTEYYDYIDLDISSLVQDIVNNPNSSFGLLFKLQTEEYYRSVIFASSDHTDSSKHPKLEIFYNEPNSQCLIADYSFSGNADDVSGNNNNGTIYGATLTTDRFDNENSAYYFDGVNDYINLNDALLPTDGSDWSTSLWFKSENDNDGDLKNILAQYQWTEGRFHIFEYNNQLTVFSSSMEHGYSIADITEGWNNLIVTCSNNLMNIYLNCELVAENILIDTILNTNTLIGDDGSTSPNRFFKGKIDDIRVYSCVLTDEEVYQLCEQEDDNCLVADYSFSGNADDISGNNINGTVFGASLTTDRFGNDNSAYYFDGVNDYINVPQSTPFNFGEGDFAISTWVKTTNSISAGMIFQKGSTSAYQGPQFWLRSPDNWLNHDLVFLTSDSNPPSPYTSVDNIEIADGYWHHIVAQRNGSFLELYFDGYLVSSSITNFKNINDNIGAIIGAQHPHPGNYEIHNFFMGSIDDIKIYQCALTDEEIQELYEPEVQCLVADYPFSGNADDISGNNNDGTVYGAHLTSDRYGIENSAYYFHGYHDYIDFNSSLLPTDGSDWSASMWYKSDNNHIRKVQNLFSQFNDSLGSFHVFEYYNQLKVFSTNMENAYVISETNSFWNNLVFTCSNNMLSVYINNDLVAEHILIDNLAVANTMLGFDVFGPKNHFYQGKIDDVKFFHCVLSEEEISNLYFYTQSDTGEKHSVKLYPNPTYSSITVATENYNNIISEIQIYDINGKLVLQKMINSYIKEFDISELPQAIYLIKIKIGNSVITKKFFKLTD